MGGDVLSQDEVENLLGSLDNEFDAPAGAAPTPFRQGRPPGKTTPEADRASG